MNDINLSGKEKQKNYLYGFELYRNLPEDEVQRQFEYRKSYSKMQKKKKIN